MISPYPPGNIVNSGAVGRAVFQSSDWKKTCKGNVPISIFLNRSSLTKISVFILNITSDKQLTIIGDNMAGSRGQNRTFYGWAELSVADAGKNKREVRATPQPDNQWHADIVLPSIVETDKKERERHADQLAKMANHRPPVR